jgi:predicted ArsR family transcriptional regulator
MTSTRELVLKNLLQRQRCTINDLADAVKINPISVRHHITKLEADGFVSSEEERHGVGRPRRIYFLTEAGLEQFPSRYLNLSTRLLQQLKETLPKNTVQKLFKRMAEEIAEETLAEIDIAKLCSQERADLIAQILTGEGFTVEVKRSDDRYYIKETSCPYYHIGQDHPEICSLDHTLITEVFGAKVEKTHCMLDGDAFCTYVAPLIPASEIELSETNV